MSRLGFAAAHEVAQVVFTELKERGLARETEDQFSIPMRREVRSLILVLLAQILRRAGAKNGLDLWPSTDVPQVHLAMQSLLKLPGFPSASQWKRR